MPDHDFDTTFADGRRLRGSVAAGFEAVAQAFAANFAERGEVGASVCAIVGSETVVDVWGGTAEPKTGRPWERDTISIVFSCTKAATALCAHILSEAGKLPLHLKVADLWPAFAQVGKAETTVAMMLAHTSPVPHLRATIPPGGLTDWDTMVALVEAEPAWWVPGSRQGYHGLTYAWTVGNLVRLAAGEPLGAYFARHVAAPLGLDFHIGLAESEEPRVASMINPDMMEADPNSPFLQAVLTDPDSLPHLFMANTGGASYNDRAIHAAEIGSANGITNARGLAGLYAPLATGGGGLVSPETIARMSRVHAATFLDATLLQPIRFGLGFMVSTDNRATGGDSVLIGERAFGHVGMGGSVGFADPALGLAFGYTMNRMGAGILVNARGQSLIDAVYGCLGLSGNASGAWR